MKSTVRYRETLEQIQSMLVSNSDLDSAHNRKSKRRPFEESLKRKEVFFKNKVIYVKQESPKN